MSKTPQNWIIVAIGLACVVVYAPALLASARRCEATRRRLDSQPSGRRPGVREKKRGDPARRG